MNERVLNNPPPPRSINSQISPELQEIIYRALEREPTNRYKTADEFAWDLAHPEQVGVAERIEELTNWKKRRDPWARRAAFYVAMALIPIVVLGLLFFAAKHV
jgi:serine/threonine-protein kinase